MTRQDVPGPPSGRMLRGAESEVEQMHNYISRIGCNLHEAIRNRDADLIRSYRRALHSGMARAHETTNREAGARGWDPAAVDCMLQEVEESTATLLQEAEQVLLELEEEARAKACSSPGEIATILLREAMAEPRLGSLRQATGRGSPPHR